MKARVGGILKAFEVHRKDGTIERYDKPIHNLINMSMLNETSIFAGYFSGWAAYSIECPLDILLIKSTAAGGLYQESKRMLSGVYSQSGTTVTRVSGEDIPGTNCTLVWESTGDWMYVTGGNEAARSVSKSLSIGPGTSNLWVIRTDLRGNSSSFVYSAADNVFDVNDYNYALRDATYSAGVFTSKNTQIMRSSAPGVGKSISVAGVCLTGSNSSTTHIINFSPITLNEGDRILIGVGDFEVTWTMDDYQPRILGSCPLTGLTTSCRTQRLSPVLWPENASGVQENGESKEATRIWLISDANKMTLPADLGLINAPIAPATLTPMETIVATGTAIVPTPTNESLHGNQAIGTVVTGGTVKQIVWGDTTHLFGVIEFDTPQTINPGQVITIGSRLQVRQDYVVP